jgi:hypothetical protein
VFIAEIAALLCSITLQGVLQVELGWNCLALHFELCTAPDPQKGTVPAARYRIRSPLNTVRRLYRVQLSICSSATNIQNTQISIWPGCFHAHVRPSFDPTQSDTKHRYTYVIVAWFTLCAQHRSEELQQQ